MSKILTEKRNDLQAKATQIIAKAKEEGRAVTADEKAEFDNCMNEIGAIDQTIKSEEALNALPSLKVDDGTGAVENKARSLANKESEDIKNFANFIRSKANGVANITTGMKQGDSGDVIPGTIAKKIVEKVNEISPLYALSTQYDYKGTLDIPVEDTSSDEITVDFIDELAEVPEHSNKFTTIKLSDYAFSSIVKISKKFLNNSDIDLVEWVVKKTATRIKVFLDKVCMVGGNSGKCKGVFGSYDDTNMKVPLASKTAITAEELIDLQSKVPDDLQDGAIWFMTKATRTKIAKLKDGQGNYLLIPDFANAGKFNLLGHEVRLNESVEELGAINHKVIVYGNPAALATKKLKDLEMQVLYERYADINAVAVKPYGEMDAAVEDKRGFAVAVCPSA